MKKIVQMITGIRNNFSKKIIVSLLGIIIVSFFVTGYFISSVIMKLFEDEVKTQFTKANEQTIERLGSRLDQIYRISHAVVFNPFVEKTIVRLSKEKDYTSYTKYSEQQDLNDMLYQIKTDNPFILSMFLYDLGGSNYYSGQNHPALPALNNGEFENIRMKLKSSEGDLIWMYTRVNSLIDPGGYRNVVLAARWMKNQSLETYGIMMLYIDDTFFDKSLSGLFDGGMGKSFLFGPEGDLLYSLKGESYTPNIPRLISDEDTTIVTIDDTSYLFVKSASSEVPFSLISGVSLETIQGKSRSIFKMIVYSGLVSALLTSIIITIASVMLLRPIKDLTEGMRQITKGNFNTRIPIRTNDELGMITKSFNSMSEHINSLINEVYLRKISEREAELRALQAQLNPHFLYNIFNEIYWKLYLLDAKDTANLIYSLSDMLKYSLKPIQVRTTVGEEIGQVQNYLKIQDELFVKDLETLIQANDEVLKSVMMRSLLQSLLENVFVHAFRNQITKKILMIKAFRQEDQLIIEVIDNGKGMEEETLQTLLKQGQKETHSAEVREHIGLRSVVRRIEMIYGEPYRLEAFSRLNKGTRMRLVLPWQPSIEYAGEERERV